MTLPTDLDARLDAVAQVLDVPKARIARRALTAYFDGLPFEERSKIAELLGEPAPERAKPLANGESHGRLARVDGRVTRATPEYLASLDPSRVELVQ